MKPIFFASPAEFRRWLKQHHRSETALWVGYYKRHTGRPSLTWPQSVDEALCFGWIDGIRKSLDAERYMIRFTPRNPNSIWSAVNTRRAEELIREKRMQAAGLKVYKARDPKKTAVYLFERETAQLTPEAEEKFRANPAAWKFFESQPPGYRKIAALYVMTAKQEATRARRLAALIADSAAGRRIGPMRRPGQ